MTVLEAKDVYFTYSPGTPFRMDALRGVSLKIEKGEYLAIIGHTGSGKSTLIQHFNALIEPDKGQIMLDGQDINASKESKRDSRFKVGLCFQYPEYQLFESTVYDDISFGPKNMGLEKEEIKRRVLRASCFVGLEEEKLQRSPFDLSGGEKRRAAIAGVMAMEPEILVMDEPAAGLDPRGRRDIMAMINSYRRETGSTVVIVSHSMEEVAEQADRVAVMENGEITLLGSVKDVFSQSEKLAAIGLGIPQITAIINELRKRGANLPADIYSVKEAKSALLELFGRVGKGNA